MGAGQLHMWRATARGGRPRGSPLLVFSDFDTRWTRDSFGHTHFGQQSALYVPLEYHYTVAIHVGDEQEFTRGIQGKVAGVIAQRRLVTHIGQSPFAAVDRVNDQIVFVAPIRYIQKAAVGGGMDVRSTEAGLELLWMR